MKFNKKYSILFASGLILFLIVILLAKSTSSNNQTADLTPTVVPKMIDGERYQHPMGYSLQIPDGYRVDQLNEYSVNILPAVDSVGVGPVNFVYVSVVTPQMRDSTGEVYNYNPIDYQKLIELENLGDSVNLASDEVPEMADWFEYTLVSIESIDGGQIKKYENIKPWEFPNGTTESRFIYDSGENIYILGYYTGGEGVDEKNMIDPRIAFDVIMSFKK